MGKDRVAQSILADPKSTSMQKILTSRSVFAKVFDHLPLLFYAKSPLTGLISREAAPMSGVFSDKVRRVEDNEAEGKELHAKIGKLAVENGTGLTRP